ncbi:caspase family protein [Glycomyces sp. YM15]|uniref:caspase family protein n=1 Tax=Glycomyces sp. YM15 TaxID=2800446 RepID=UPI00196662AC|nr:caspase family protein [Glycomyces sp. YM15]
MPERRYRALLIGNAVFRRDPQGLPKLQGPRADVDALFEALSDAESGLFGAEDIEALIDRNLQNLREELHRFFIEDATRDDVLFLYYSGHGKLDLLGRLHLCASDTRVNALPVTALRYKDDIDALIEASPAIATVTILDCCHSGAFRGGDLKVEANGSGRCVITSASANELAIDAIGPGGTSPFTNALVSGLRYAQAPEHLTARGLYDYIEGEVGTAGNSRPQFYFDGEGAIVVARRGPACSPGPAGQEEPGRPYEPEAEADELEEEDPAPPGLVLPEARTHLWRLLNEAAQSALSGDDGDGEPHALLFEVVKDSVRLDAKWANAVLKRLGSNRERQVVVEGLAAGLAERDPDRAIDFAREFAAEKPERIGAHLAVAASLNDATGGLREGLLMAAIAGCGWVRGRHAPRMIARVLEIEARAGEPTPDGGDEPLIRAAKRLSASTPEVWDALSSHLKHSIERLDRSSVPAVQAEVALQLATFDPVLAGRFFLREGNFLWENASEHLPISQIARCAATMIDSAPPIGHRLFEIAERRCRSEADWTALFITVMQALAAPPGPSLEAADRLVSVVERAIDQVADHDLRRLPHAAEHLVASAPAAAARLLRCDPDEDRVLAGLIRIIRPAADVDVYAARQMADTAERMALSILDETEQAERIADLAAAYAAIDPAHARRLLHSIPETGYRREMAIADVAEVLSASAPDQIQTLVDEFAGGEPSERLLSSVFEGVAQTDPAWAIRVASSDPGSPYLASVIAAAAQTMAARSPEEAAQVARGLQDPFRRAHTLCGIVRIVARDHPERAAEFAWQIPSERKCAYARASALSVAARAIAELQPSQAEELVSLAVSSANMLEDGNLKGSVLCEVARVAAGFAPTLASRLLLQAEQCVSTETTEAEADQTRILTRIMVVWAVVAPKQAERLLNELPGYWGSRDYDLGVAGGGRGAPPPPPPARIAALKSRPAQGFWGSQLLRPGGGGGALGPRRPAPSRAIRGHDQRSVAAAEHPDLPRRSVLCVRACPRRADRTRDGARSETVPGAARGR